MELRELARGSNCSLLGFVLFEIEQWRKEDILVMEQDARCHEPEARAGQLLEFGHFAWVGRDRRARLGRPSGPSLPRQNVMQTQPCRRRSPVNAEH
jgi:hypothetical protein